MNEPLVIEPFGGVPDGAVTVPGSKSITNRALVAAALAEGTSTLRGVLFSDDTAAMLDCLASLGITTTVDEAEHTVTVVGCGGAIPASSATLGVRQSGTTARFIVPMLALANGQFVVDGHPQMRSRPMAELAGALSNLGVGVESAAGDHLPFTVRPSPDSTTSECVELVVRGDQSSQFLSGLLLSASYAHGGSSIRVDGELISKPYVDMTIQVMRSFGVGVEVFGDTYLVAPACFRSTDYLIEPDASAASYFFGLAAITGGRIRIDGLGSTSLQGDLRFVSDLAQMGCQVTMTETSTTVQGPPRGLLRGGVFDMSSHSDTAPTMAAVAVFANAPVTVTGVGFIRHKESDRVGGVVKELLRCGIDAVEHDDGFTVTPGTPQPTLVETYEDHRMAMSFALLGTHSAGIRIADPGCVAKTFGGFFDVLGTVRAQSGGLAQTRTEQTTQFPMSDPGDSTCA